MTRSRAAVKVGDVVVCVDTGPSLGSIKPAFRGCLQLGQRYVVRDVRDAGLCPPKGEVPDEVLVRSRPLERIGCQDWWYPARYFRPTPAKRRRR